MIRLLTLTMVLLCSAVAAQSQTNTITGSLKDDADGKPVAGSTISLLKQSDSSLVKTTVSDSAGNYKFTDVPLDSFIIAVNTINYQQYTSFITMIEGEKVMGAFSLQREGKDLANVTIVAQAAPVVQKGDTTQYSASQYKVNPDATTEDLIKKNAGHYGR